jgi:hypothetical protein
MKNQHLELGLLEEVREGEIYLGVVLSEWERNYVCAVVGGDKEYEEYALKKLMGERGLSVLNYRGYALAKWFIGEIFFIGGDTNSDKEKGVGDV